LLRTLDRIKNKLRKNITKKLNQDKNENIQEFKEQKMAEAFGRNYVPAPAYGTTYHDILRKKKATDRKLRKENDRLLFQGLPTTYNTKIYKF